MYDTTSLDWLPSLKLGYEEKTYNAEVAVGRDDQAKSRESKKRDIEAALGYYQPYGFID